MIKIGILGAGFIAKIHIKSYEKVEDCKIIGVWDIKNSINALDIHKEFGIKVYEKAEDLIQEVDIVDICLPTFLHHKYTIMAAKVGKNIILEKPMAMNVKEAEEIISVVKQIGIRMIVAHCIRFWPEYVFLKNIIENKALGELLYLNCFRYSSVPLWSIGNWLLDNEKSKGMVVDLHIHDSDFILFACGKPKGVVSKEFKYLNRHWIRTEYDFEREVFISSEGGWIAPENYKFIMGWNAIFQCGIIEYNSREVPSIYVCTDKGIDLKYDIPDTDGYIEEIKYMVNCVNNEVQPEIATVEDGINALKITFAESASIRENKYIKLDF